MTTKKPRARDHERGASAVEYALMISGIAAVIVVAVVLLGGTVTEMFQDTCEAATTPSAIEASCE